jgi:lipopolysaccharide transport system permease protein
VLQTVFFVTPIFWSANLLGERRWIVDFNPLYHLIEIARAPMLNEYPSMVNYGVVIAISVFGWGLALMFYSRFHKRVVYWL